ncbi:hypothetical protein COCSUDRAFT_33412 [Coccomyxa subellipsoidea C-169]|uniref:Uncharacterized protein n=1 Tax=Coccomyxa subellipsoidea (strain C-169) TaxID=574566 RepID=I0YWV1_COCSC|nr:hypothetical protein COCSUDRAFT_33412 [Coccomyxa subellipsoidea C-169]EIE22870.1 hypothetical protein COCSUDRAFT_33412 [Coccomyxa subellipsoidea C-169]|eukprot:XP_005647414.1 hypothetical protein COCSUDRAFT_33412 [Coccomyxa subellipsoidea C-169]
MLFSDFPDKATSFWVPHGGAINCRPQRMMSMINDLKIHCREAYLRNPYFLSQVQMRL